MLSYDSLAQQSTYWYCYRSFQVLVFILGIPCPPQPVVGVAMRDLLSELQELTNWFYFGVCVGVHQATLKEIRQDYEDTEECKREMLAVWRKNEIATWSKVIRALAEVGMPRLALEIASKYGMPREHKIILLQKFSFVRMQIIPFNSKSA